MRTGSSSSTMLVGITARQLPECAGPSTTAIVRVSRPAPLASGPVSSHLPERNALARRQLCLGIDLGEGFPGDQQCLPHGGGADIARGVQQRLA